MKNDNPHKLSARRIIIPVVLAIAAVLALVCFIRPNFNAPKLPPADLAQTAIDNLLSAESLSFRTESELVINNDTTSLGEITGQLCGSDFHVAGEMLGAPLNIYQLGQTTWRQDTITEQWLKTEDGLLLTESALMDEIDPRAAFRLTAILDAAEADTENLEEEKCYTVTFHPQTESGYYEKYFDELTYTLWITMDDHQLRQCRITAAASSGTQTSQLCITSEFWDWNATPPIEAPAFN